MKIELLGSLGIFVVYWLTAGRSRIVFLVLIGLAILYMEQFVYLAFVLGALMYEAYFRRKINSLGNIVPYVALGIGIVLGAAGTGTAQRWGIPDFPDPITVGNKWGIIPVVAASLIMFAVIALPKVGRCLSNPVTVWLGRVSFALYLVHVPVLYTLVAFGFVHLNWSIGVLALTYLLLVLMLSHLFTISVDEPVLRQLPNVSRVLHPLDHATGVLRVRRISRHS